ncbi:MAG: ribonuclease J [Candidatus Caenarcaniphilales bacterium]|nr:ribonuclease J [Candidatus Caenarcaniphilales bacterium]
MNNSDSSSQRGSNSRSSGFSRGNRPPSRPNHRGGRDSGWRTDQPQIVKSSYSRPSPQQYSSGQGQTRVAFPNTNKGTSQAPPQLGSNKLRIIPISGQCELGRSCWCFEQDKEIVIVDAGIGFVPHGFKGGVDAVIPDLEYLLENKQKVKALVVSNPHEEYAGHFLNFLEELEIKEVYLPPILAELYKDKIPSDIKVTRLETCNKYEIGEQFKITPYTVTFSAVDSFALLIEALSTKVFYTGAMKIDHEAPISHGQTNIQDLACDVTQAGVDFLISSSVNVESGGYTNSESSVKKKFNDIFANSKGRTITLISCSHLHRLKTILDSAKENDRKVCILGDEIKAWYQAAKSCGYLNYDESLFVEDPNSAEIDPNKICIVIGSLEGHILKPFISLAYKDYPHTSLKEGDTIIVSANPPLGTTRVLANAIDQLFLQGVGVIGGRDAGVHVTGYASQEELKFIYNLTRPKYFIPSHGESRLLVLHAELLNKCGVDPQNVVILDNGCAIDFDLAKSTASLSGKISAKSVFFNKSLDSNMGHRSLEERKNLSEDGTITIVLAVDFKNAKLIAGPTMTMYGSSFDTSSSWQNLVETINRDITNAVNKSLMQGQKDTGILRHLTHDLMSKKIRENFGMSKPVLSIVIQEV